MNNFNNFSANKYLKEYYSELWNENKKLLNFYHQTFSKIGHQKTMLEFGGGPSVWQLISASKNIDKIIFSEFSRDCRKEVKNFLENKNSFNWKEYFGYAAKLENTKENLSERIRSKVKEVIKCDFRLKNPLSARKLPLFDVISMGSVVETSANTEKEFANGMKNVFSLLKKSGYFIGYFSRNCKKWDNGKLIFKNFPINEVYIENFLPKIGLKIIKLKSFKDKDYNQDYQGIFCVFAKKIK